MSLPKFKNMFDFLRAGILGVGKRDFGPEWTSTVLLLLPLLVIFLPGAAITAVASAAARKTHFFGENGFV
jgi:hypothetical protein